MRDQVSYAPVNYCKLHFVYVTLHFAHVAYVKIIG